MSTTSVAADAPTERAGLPNLTYAEAVRAALRRAMTELPETLLYGEDIAKPGGVFGVTRGLQREFGDRVFDMPISESAILGSAVGAAMFGRRPIVEIMWADFSLVALDQIVNQLANVRYVSRGRLTAPVVIRTQQGSAPGACAQHSQSLEALFLHVPGLRVCMPWTIQDAHDLLLASVYADDPVLVIENRTLYHGIKEEVVVDGPVQAIGGIRVRRPGADITAITWGSMTGRVLAAADQLQADGIDVDVVETPWLNPFPTEAVLERVARTRRAVIIHEANVTGGFGAEVVARIATSGIGLDAPIGRLGLPDVRVPAAVSLLDALVPSVDDICAVIRERTVR
jgi:acetoin:2,6-dichlorophenolindophenol oxidoreductase subunit beta